MTTLYGDALTRGLFAQQVPTVLPAFTGSTAPAPTVSVSFGYLAVQSVEPTTPERTRSLPDPGDPAGGGELRSREEERGGQEDEGAASEHVAVWIGTAFPAQFP